MCFLRRWEKRNLIRKKANVFPQTFEYEIIDPYIKVWRARPGGFANTQSLLVWDSFSAHLTDTVKQQLRENKTATAVIPGGLTSLVQPLDVCLNKPFKDHLREKWMTWMMSGEKTFTPGGQLRAASLVTVCQ